MRISEKLSIPEKICLFYVITAGITPKVPKIVFKLPIKIKIYRYKFFAFSEMFLKLAHD